MFMHSLTNHKIVFLSLHNTFFSPVASPLLKPQKYHNLYKKTTYVHIILPQLSSITGDITVTVSLLWRSQHQVF